jgi:hypothetical protein
MKVTEFQRQALLSLLDALNKRFTTPEKAADAIIRAIERGDFRDQIPGEVEIDAEKQIALKEVLG